MPESITSGSELREIAGDQRPVHIRKERASTLPLDDQSRDLPVLLRDERHLAQKIAHHIPRTEMELQVRVLRIYGDERSFPMSDRDLRVDLQRKLPVFFRRRKLKTDVVADRPRLNAEGLLQLL